MASDPNDPTTTDDEHQPIGADRVQIVSKRADGTPDQTPGFEVIDNDEEPPAEDETPKRRTRKASTEEAVAR